MKNWNKEQTLNYLFKSLLILIAIIGFVLLYYYALPALGVIAKFAIFAALPFILAWVFAILSSNATGFFHKKLHMPMGLAVMVMVLLVFGVLGTIIALIVARLWVEISNIAVNMPQYYQSCLNALSWLQEKLGAINIGTEELATIKNWLNDVFSNIGTWLSSVAGGTVNVISATPTVFIFILVFFMALFFFCRDHKKIIDKTAGFLPVPKRDKIIAIYDRFVDVVRGFCVAQLGLIGISMLLCILFFFVLGVDGAITIGLFCGILDILPIVGPSVIIIPWAIMSLINGKLFLGIGLCVLLIVLTVVKNVLQPKLVGDKIGLHPLLTLAGIFVGMKIFGIWGLALGPIILAMVVCIYRSVKEINGK